MNLTDAHLSDIQIRAEDATPGPWGWHEMGDQCLVATGMGPGTIGSVSYVQRIAVLEEDDAYEDEDLDDEDLDDDEGRCQEQTRANAAFIAHAREDVQTLLAEVARLRAELTAASTERG